MTTDLQQRIAAINAECEEILKLSAGSKWKIDHEGNRILAEDDRQTIVAHMSASLRNPEVMQDASFIAASRNVSPAMARVVLFAINSLLAASATITNDDILTGMEQSLESIASQWEGK